MPQRVLNEIIFWYFVVHILGPILNLITNGSIIIE